MNYSKTIFFHTQICWNWRCLWCSRFACIVLFTNMKTLNYFGSVVEKFIKSENINHLVPAYVLVPQSVARRRGIDASIFFGNYKLDFFFFEKGQWNADVERGQKYSEVSSLQNLSRMPLKKILLKMPSFSTKLFLQVMPVAFPDFVDEKPGTSLWMPYNTSLL